MDSTRLLVTLAAALGAASVGAACATRLGQPTTLGYLLAGVAIGPFTPGFVGDIGIVSSLAEVGIALLMFAIGVQLPFREVRRIGARAAASAVVQVLVTLALGALVASLFGSGFVEALFFGAVISNSSSTVISKLLGERGEIDSEHGRLALAWSSVQDLGTIVLVVVLGALAGHVHERGLVGDLAWSLGRAALFLVLLLPIGSALFERIFRLQWILRSREIFVVAVAASALGVAWLSTKFGLSMALGAFAAGIVVADSDLSHHVLASITPLRDVFAGLFFVSIGMLVDPRFLLAHPLFVLVILSVIVLVKGLVSAAIALAVKMPTRVALLVGAALAQSAEFSFLLARLGADLGAISEVAFNVMLTASVCSIVLAPAVDRLARIVAVRFGLPSTDEADRRARPAHAVICGHGRVGRAVAATLEGAGLDYVVIDDRLDEARALRDRGVEVVIGDASAPTVLERASIAAASVVVIALPDALAARSIVDHVRAVNEHATIVARTHSEHERTELLRRGASEVLVAELEIGNAMATHVLQRLVPARATS